MSNPLCKLKDGFHLPCPPTPLVLALVIGGVVGLIPLGVIAKAKSSNNKKSPRIHLWMDMDHQAKIKAQSESTVFADGRGNRLPVAGTVAQGGVKLDDHLYLGFAVNEDLTPVTKKAGDVETNIWYDGLPAAVTSAWGGGEAGLELLIKRGQDQYNVYCFTCHGMGGNGDGPTHTRASSLMKRGDLGTTTTWSPPANLNAITYVYKKDANGKDVLDAAGEPIVVDQYPTYGRAQNPDGQLFDVISNGKGNMAGYRSQISPEDRWAIVAYVRALQAANQAAASE